MLKSRYSGGWEKIEPDCMLCRMTKRTEWHLETKEFIIAEKLTGGPFIVRKRHTKELTDEMRDKAERLVSLIYDDFELVVKMNLVKDHWHAHIVTGGGDGLSFE